MFDDWDKQDWIKLATNIIMILATIFIAITVSGPDFQTAVACKSYKPLVDLVRTCHNPIVDCLDGTQLGNATNLYSWKQGWIDRTVPPENYTRDDWWEDNETLYAEWLKQYQETRRG